MTMPAVMQPPAGAVPAVAPRRRPRIGPFRIFSLLLLLLTAALILYPLGTVVDRAFFDERSMGLAGIWTQLTRPAILKVFADTALVVGMSSTLALAIGSAFAWLIERTDARTGLASEFLPLMPLLVPQISGVIGWAIMLSPEAGLVNGWLRMAFRWFGMDLATGPFNIFSFTGLVCVMTLYLVPYVYLTVAAALQNLNPSLEEAARMCRAGPWKTLLRVTLPAVWPAIVNAGIIVAIFGISTFSVPIVIGTTAGIDLLSVRIYRLLYNHPPRTDLAVVLAIAMMVFVQLALLVQVLVTRSQRHAVVGGKGATHTRVRLGRWRWVARGAIGAYLLATAVLPVAALAIVSLQPFWTSKIDFAQFGWANYHFVLVENATTARALVNSIGLGIFGATLCMLGAAVLVLFARNASAGTQMVVDGVTALPATLPHTVVAVSIVLAFTGGVFNLYGTLTILLLANLVLVIPQAVRSARSALAQVGNDMVEAAQMSRASPFGVFRRIVVPLMLPGLMAGWVILFVQISGELTASALLSGTGNPVVGLVLLDLWENGSFPQLSAIALVMTVIDAVVVLAVMKGFRRNRG
jgi:iron(III) transport system permease protein